MERASVIFLWFAFLLYGAAFAVFLYHLFSRRPAMNRAGMVLAAVGLVFHTAALVCRGISAGHVPVVGAYESLVLVAWSVTLVYHVLESFTRIKAVGLYVMPVVLVLLTTAWSDYRAPVGLVPALRSDVVVVHVIVMLVAVGCLYVAGGAALIYLIERDQLKRRRVGRRAGPSALSGYARQARLPCHTARPAVPDHGHGRRRHPRRHLRRAALVGDPLVLLALAAGASMSSCSGVACAAAGVGAGLRGWRSSVSSCCSSSASWPCLI